MALPQLPRPEQAALLMVAMVEPVGQREAVEALRQVEMAVEEEEREAEMELPVSAVMAQMARLYSPGQRRRTMDLKDLCGLMVLCRWIFGLSPMPWQAMCSLAVILGLEEPSGVTLHRLT
jgi:hypothetical protein